MRFAYFVILLIAFSCVYPKKHADEEKAFIFSRQAALDYALKEIISFAREGANINLNL
jgi:hypothetical protein